LLPKQPLEVSEPLEKASDSISQQSNLTDRPSTPQIQPLLLVPTASNQQRPSVTVTSAYGDSVNIAVTPRNITQLHKLISQIIRGDRALTPSDITSLMKVEKFAEQKYAESILQQSANKDLLAAINEREKSKSRSRGYYGCARVLGIEVLYERAWAAVWEDLQRISLDVFSYTIGKKPRVKAKQLSGRGNIRAFATAVKPFLLLSPSLFQGSYRIPEQFEFDRIFRIESDSNSTNIRFGRIRIAISNIRSNSNYSLLFIETIILYILICIYNTSIDLIYNYIFFLISSCNLRLSFSITIIRNMSPVIENLRIPRISRPY
jgi:hypothetical protein